MSTVEQLLPRARRCSLLWQLMLAARWPLPWHGFSQLKPSCGASHQCLPMPAALLSYASYDPPVMNLAVSVLTVTGPMLATTRTSWGCL